MHSERRIEPRALCADLVTLGWFDGRTSSKYIPAVLEDISSTGACLQTESRVPDNAEAFIQNGEWIIACRVSYCVFREIGYFVGVKFGEGDEWSKEDYLPQHLFNVHEFAEIPA